MAVGVSQPTYIRQRFLLAFIRQIKSGVKSTDLQKLVFLYLKSTNSNMYEFIPYKFGSYSFQLAEDVDILHRDGYLLVDGSRILAAGDYLVETPFSIATERGDTLIRKAYRAYPYYAINSEITSRLFSEAEAKSFEEKRKSFAKTNQVLFTIGYEGKSIEAFINVLIRNNIRVLCDVRKNPLSRKFGFSKSKLQHVLEIIGIKYIHLPDLGIDSDKRHSLNTVDDYQQLFNKYQKSLPNLKPQLDALYSLLLSDDRIALMCYEKDPQMCHRHVIRDFISDVHPIRSIDL